MNSYFTFCFKCKKKRAKLLHGICTHSLSRLQRIQNRAARILTRSMENDNITPVLVKLQWLPIEQWIQYKLILQASKALHRTSPVYIKELVHVYKPNRFKVLYITLYKYCIIIITIIEMIIMIIIIIIKIFKYMYL